MVRMAVEYFLTTLTSKYTYTATDVAVAASSIPTNSYRHCRVSLRTFSRAEPCDETNSSHIFPSGQKELLVPLLPQPRERKSQSNNKFFGSFSFSLYCTFLCIKKRGPFFVVESPTMTRQGHYTIQCTFRKKRRRRKYPLESIDDHFLPSHALLQQFSYYIFFSIFQMIRTIAVWEPESPTLSKTIAKAKRSPPWKRAAPRSKWRWHLTSAPIRRPCLMATRCRLTRCGTRGASTVEWVWDLLI